MTPVKSGSGQVESWLVDAPKELLLELLVRLLGDSPAIRSRVEDAWKRILQSPDLRQHREIRDAVADVFQRRFRFPDAAAKRLAVELLGSTSEPTDQTLRQEIALPLAEWQQVRDAVLSVDVLYQTTEVGSHTVWRRQTRVFLRDDADGVRNITQEVELRWEDLPSDVREACIKQAQIQQRFVLFCAGAAAS
jgi:hypothetical protein